MPVSRREERKEGDRRREGGKGVGSVGGWKEAGGMGDGRVGEIGLNGAGNGERRKGWLGGRRWDECRQALKGKAKGWWDRVKLRWE